MIRDCIELVVVSLLYGAAASDGWWFAGDWPRRDRQGWVRFSTPLILIKYKEAS